MLNNEKERIVSVFVTIAALTISSYGSIGQPSRPTGGPSERIITGIVKNEKGQPVKDALIMATMPFIDAGKVTTEMVTNTEGKFSFRISMNPGSGLTSSPSPEMTTYIIARHKERNLANIVQIISRTNNYEITLSPGVIFSGKVVDANGAGIPKAETLLGYWVSNRSSVVFPEPTKIDANGIFEIRAVPQGYKYSVYASAEGYGQQYVEVDINETKNERIKLEPMVLYVANLSVSGIVVDQNSQPVSNARVNVSGNGQPRITSSGKTPYDFKEIRTNTKGEFKIESICPGELTLEITTAGPPSRMARARVKGGDKDIKIVVSSLSLGRAVPRQPPSLSGKPLPSYENIKIDISPEQSKDKRILICFWNNEQQTSRNCVLELNKKAETLKSQNIQVVLIYSLKIEKEYLDKWLKENSISFPVGIIQNNVEQIRFNWMIKAIPWLILTDKNHMVTHEGFSINELDEKIKESEK
jgi:protocatechuate 3,4-dioxygenase beta subunit